MAEKQHVLTQEDAVAAVYGGAFLGGGGGGSLEAGLENVRAAFSGGPLRLLPAGEVEDEAVLVTASMVGSPAQGSFDLDAAGWKHLLELYRGLGQGVDGIITNENGGCSTTNGWVLSAVTGIPLVDAPCNGRAHPTGQMGSMGLQDRKGFVSRQAAVAAGSASLELAVSGSLDAASRLVRLAASEAGGVVAVLRNGVEAAYVKENAACGAIRQAVRTGRAFLGHPGDCGKTIGALSELFSLRVLASGRVERFGLSTEGGYDVGSFRVGGVEVSFWNEFMTADRGGERLATFPDLIAVLDGGTGAVKTSAQIAGGDRVALVAVPREQLILGRGMFFRPFLEEAGRAVKKSL